MNKRAPVLIVLALVLASLSYALAQEASPSPQGTPTPAPAAQSTQKPAAAPEARQTYPNVRIEVTITDQAGTGAAIKKTMSVVANRQGSVRSGVNVPMVQTTFGSTDTTGARGNPVTSYSYRTMGLNLDARDVYLSPAGLIHVQLSLEYNPIDESTEKSTASASTPGLASYSNFSQSFTLDLENGKPIMAAVTSDPVPSRNRTLSVEVKATIVK